MPERQSEIANSIRPTLCRSATYRRKNVTAVRHQRRSAPAAAPGHAESSAAICSPAADGREAGVDRNGAPYVLIHIPTAQFLSMRLTKRQRLNGDPDSLRQVHKEAGIGLQVPDPDATGDKINDMVKETGGYVAANNLIYRTPTGGSRGS